MLQICIACVKHTQKSLLIWLFAVGIGAVLGGCVGASSPTLFPLSKEPTWEVLSTSITAAIRPGQGGWRIYIEGDGHAFNAAGQPSINPTPRQPIALELAQRDPTPLKVMYLARPCQWATTQQDCTDASIWTTERFTADKVARYSQIIHNYTHDEPIEIIGFSGGAWLALQIAAALPQVKSVRTVAGNLEPNTVNAFHRVPSLEVAAYSPQVANIPQVHFYGTRDRVIPPTLAASYQSNVAPKCAKWVAVEGASHTKGWQEQWPALLHQLPPTCAPS
jgi:hypothetical protein